MLRIFNIFLLTLASLNADSNEIIPSDFIEASCEVGYQKNIFINDDVKISLKYNNRSYIKEVFKDISSKKQNTILELSPKKPVERKWINSILSISYKDKVCKYKSRIKITGDLLDHIEFNSKSLFHSVLLELKDANLNNNIRFRIFLPTTREGDNELFGSLIYKKMGFLSPDTYRKDINVNGNMKNFIIQEEINKEFLESNNRTEGLIFEGSEIFGIQNTISLARVINPEWSIQSHQSKLITSFALNKLNKIYLKSSSNEDTPVNIWSDDLAKRDINLLRKLQSFYALSFAINGVHGLSRDDSRFYFNNVYGYFEPIYYDQKILVDREIKFKSIDHNTKSGLKSIKKMIQELDKDSFFNELLQIGYTKGRKHFNKIMNKLILNIETLESIKVAENEYLYVDNFKIGNFFKNQDLFGNFLKININDFSKIGVCDEYVENCFSQDITTTNLKNIFKQKATLNEKNYSLFIKLNNVYKNDYPISIYSLNSIPIENESILKYTSNLNVEVDIKKRKILIENKKNNNKTGRAIFHYGSLSNWSIFYKGAKNYLETTLDSNFNLNGLTGCLSFHDVILESINIELQNSSCEDGVHFLRAQGDINSLKVNGSVSDGVDMDFSNIKLNFVELRNAKNDCLDLSSGNYSVNDLSLYFCSDKGISIGEKANFTAKSILIDNALFGVVSKDSSTAVLKDGIINTKGACASAYRKKQEFNGGSIQMKNVTCTNDFLFSAEGSKIYLDKAMR